jgi:hypothetical protein
MKKIYLLLFSAFYTFIITSPANAWESKITLECINEKLTPCSSSDVSYIESNENPDLDSDKVVKKKKIVKKKADKKKKKQIKDKKEKKIVKKKANKKKKILVKNKKKKNIFMKTSSKKSSKNFDFDQGITFDEFKALVINYNNSSDYPNIDD